ncbi:MAG: hypothetical protein JWN90_316 [Parcubacteria group bacterium]|nr:hypothetical protein [Parcubacteria group bacterium]
MHIFSLFLKLIALVHISLASSHVLNSEATLAQKEPLTPITPLAVVAATEVHPKALSPKVRYADAQYAADFSNDQILMGASHNVFIAKIIEKVSTNASSGMPETQFKAEIIENIKGNLTGTITINQVGGYKNDYLYLPDESGMGLLKTGTTYLLATRYYKDKDWYTVNPYPSASKVINDSSQATSKQLRLIADSDPRVRELKAAYPNEILLEADVLRNDTINSFESLQDKPIVSSESSLTSASLNSSETSTTSQVVSPD